MAKRIIYIVIVLVVALSCWYFYERHSQQAALNGGAVTSTDAPQSSKELMDTGAVDIDGHPMNDTGSTGQTGSSGNSGSTGTTAAPLPAVRTLSNAAPVSAMAQGIRAIAPTTVASKPATALPSSLPTGDTLSPTPPQGMAFGGSGKFQWYRQGNITWRIDTASGSSCVAFATMDEWHKPLVYSHGCGNG